MLPVESSDISFAAGGVHFNLRACGVAVIDGRVLLHRLRGEAYWSLPGGRCRIDETMTETLEREIREEIGVRVSAGRLLWVVEQWFDYQGRTIHELGFYFAVRRPQVLAGEHVPIERNLEYAWFPVDRLPTVKPPFLVEALANDLPCAARYVDASLPGRQ